MGCLYFPTWFKGFMSIILILLITIIITFIVVFYGMKHYIINDWDTYKCNPLFMPFVGMFGYDLIDNFNICLDRNIKQSSKSVLTPYDDAFDSIDSTLKGFSSVIQKSQQVMNIDTMNVTSGMNTVIGRMGNISATGQLLIMKIKSIFQKLIALYISLLYAAWSIMNGLTAIINDKNIKKAGIVLDKFI